MPNEAPVNEAVAAENAAVNTVSLNNLSPADNADAEPEKKPPLSRLIILLLLPANLLWALPIYAFTRSGHDMSWQTFNYIFLAYTAVFLLIYGIISYKLYPKISGKALLLASNKFHFRRLSAALAMVFLCIKFHAKFVNYLGFAAALAMAGALFGLD